MSRLQSVAPFYEDMVWVVDKLPIQEEYRRTTHLVLQRPSAPISDADLARVFAACPHLEDVILSGVPAATDRSVILLAENANNLQSIDLSGCKEVTDIAVLELASKSLPLQCIRLNGVIGLTDPSISAIAKSSPRLIELELSGLPLLSPLSVRDIWSYSR